MSKKMLMKILVLGDAPTGKTSIMNKYANDKFDTRYKATIGADFCTKNLSEDLGADITLQLWDTAGQERFQSLGVAFYRGAQAVVLCASFAEPESFNHLQGWLDEFHTQAQGSGMNVAVCITKTDLSPVEPHIQALDAFVADNKSKCDSIFWVGTSAKDDTPNVLERKIFAPLGRAVMKEKKADLVMPAPGVGKKDKKKAFGKSETKGSDSSLMKESDEFAPLIKPPTTTSASEEEPSSDPTKMQEDDW